MATTSPHTDARLRLRLVFAQGFMLGPGKAELLTLIRDTGSISAAGREMEMSYKRAWMLVETLNAAFREPLVESVRGGPNGGGARLTPPVEQALAAYLALEKAAVSAGAKHIAVLHAMLRDIPEQK